MNWMLFLQEIQYSCVEIELHYKYSSRAYEVISLFLHGVNLGNVAAKNYVKNSRIHKIYERPSNTQNSLLKRDYLTHQIQPKTKLLVSFTCFFFFYQNRSSVSFLWLRSFQLIPKFLWKQTCTLKFK